MSTVSYHNQPGIHASRGNVPLAGTAHVYTVHKVLWPREVETLLDSISLGRLLHVCCGKSKLGQCRLDRFELSADVMADAARLPFASASWDTVLCDPPYNGKFQWNHDLLSELGRVADKRIIFQHWFMPVDKLGRFKKCHTFNLTAVYCWQPRTYFGRVQVISVMDRIEQAQQQLSLLSA
jgi:hypothetical protein